MPYAGHREARHLTKRRCFAKPPPSSTAYSLQEQCSRHACSCSASRASSRFLARPHATGIKRAFNRAAQRARLHRQQGTFYRGRRCSLVHLASQPGSTPQKAGKLRLHAATASAAHRLTVLSYNAGGLTGECYQELLQRLHQLPAQERPAIVHVQETHWSTSQEFCMPGWFMISSACPSPKAGRLLTMIDSTLCGWDCISSSAQVDGRVLHVRLNLGDSTVDAINVYQKSITPGAVALKRSDSNTSRTAHPCLEHPALQLEYPSGEAPSDSYRGFQLTGTTGSGPCGNQS